MLLTSLSLSLSSVVEGTMGSKFQALQKLWLYLISKVASGVMKWNVVISRLGKPSSAEIKGVTSISIVQ